MTSAPTADRRGMARPRTFWKGTILFPGGLRSSECIVRNFTAGGARLDCGAVTDIPDHFELKIPQKGETFSCEVAWRRQSEVGVAFVPAESEGEDLLARRIKALEEQNRKLMRRIQERGSDQD